jgi:opacity protein-like surface antigen
MRRMMPGLSTAALRALKMSAVAAAAVLLLVPATASAQQSLNFSIGGFVPKGLDSRDSDDVLRNNLKFLAFDIDDFHGATYGVEWLANLGDKFEAGLGTGFYSRSVPAVYFDFVNSNGSEIEQDLKMRVVPFTATVRFLPLGHSGGFQPYIGGGVGVLSWRYSESGEFLATDGSIFRDSFVTDGTASGPLFLGGVRVPVGQWGVGFELRHQSGEGKIPAVDDFAGTSIDLGGFSYNFTVHVRF